MDIKYILVMPNGMVCVYDYNEQQMPELQGVWQEKKKDIYLAASKQDKDIFWSIQGSQIDYANRGLI